LDDTPREVYMANPTIYDVVHWSSAVHDRYFSPFCAPEIKFWGDRVAEIPGKAPRCKTCAAIMAQKKKDQHGTGK
jgi:hypothetical protein